MRRLSSADFSRTGQTLSAIADNPYSFKELWGRFRGLRSARFGDYRIIYTVVENKKQVILLAVEPRSSAYEK
jgi:mRNA-degrading endonuclease RelE of RelBE toxin-antitoxin system